MKIAASFSMGRLAPKHNLNIDGIRGLSKNVTPALIKDDVVILDNLRTRNGTCQTIDEYTDSKLQPYIDQYNAKQTRQDRRITTGYSEWHRNNGTLSQGKGELAYEAVLQYGTHDDIGGEYYSPQTRPERKAELRDEFERVYRGWVADLQRHIQQLLPNHRNAGFQAVSPEAMPPQEANHIALHNLPYFNLHEISAIDQPIFSKQGFKARRNRSVQYALFNG